MKSLNLNPADISKIGKELEIKELDKIMGGEASTSILGLVICCIGDEKKYNNLEELKKKGGTFESNK